MSTNVNYKAGTFTYIKYLRNGGTREVTGVLNRSERKREGKTERDRVNTKRTKVA